MNSLDLRKLNSMTKYPSIPTYHEIQGKGVLLPVLTQGVNFNGQEVEYTEKVDGENSRIVYVIEGNQVDYFLGSREEFLYAKGDRIINPTGNIAETLKPIADRLQTEVPFPDGIFVIYQEIYGGKINNSKEYTASRQISVRAFDMFFLPMSEVLSLMEQPLERIASWRDKGGQPFFAINQFVGHCLNFQLQRTPKLGVYADGKYMPTTIEDMYLHILKNHKETIVGLDSVGRSEGIVARTADRKVIAKIRFEDYERTLGIRGKGRSDIEKLLLQASKSKDSSRVVFCEKLLQLI